MILPAALAALTALVLAILLRPLLAARVDVTEGDDLSVYASQLDEVEADRARGLIPEAEAEAARVEIARRLLRAQRRAARAPRGGRRRLAATAVGLVVPVLAVGGYLALGAPGYGDQPLAARLAPISETELVAMVEAAEERLAERPDDVDGWAAVAPVYLRLGRFDDAAGAYRRLIALDGETPERMTGLGESLTFAARGEVPDEARRLFQRVLEVEPEAERPAIYLAIAARQRGNFGEAGERWRTLLARSTGTEAWLDIASAEFSRMGAEPGAEPGAAPAPTAGPRRDAPAGTVADVLTAGAPAAVLSGPTAQQVAAVTALPEADQAAMVAGMVDRLASRLATNSGTADEWLRLIRAYRVLGREDEARQAAADALARLAGAERERVAAADEVRALGPAEVLR